MYIIFDFFFCYSGNLENIFKFFSFSLLVLISSLIHLNLFR